MTSWIQPLDLQTLFVNYLSGSLEIFSFIAVLVIAALAATFRMPNQIALIMFVLFGVIMGVYLGGIYFLAIIITSIMVYYSIARLMK
jgi:hypothetical protein